MSGKISVELPSGNMPVEERLGMLKEHTKVSVIIPAYNTDGHIAETLVSVFAWAFKDYEIIVINTGPVNGCPSEVNC